MSLLATLMACGGGTAPPAELGATEAVALRAWGSAAATALAPWRCGALDRDPGDAPATAPAGWTLDGVVLRRAAAPPATLRLAFVGDVDGAGVTAPLDDVRRALDDAQSDVVVSLGGLGDDGATIGAALQHLSSDPARLVVALPGAREGVAAHAAGVAAAAAAGHAVIDGSRVRIVQLGEVTLATLPGLPWAARLAAGVEGCGHTAADVDALRARLHELGGRVVLASVRAPAGPASADGLTGVTAGDRTLADALSRAAPTLAPIELVVHPQLTHAAPTAGERDAATATPTILAAPRLATGPTAYARVAAAAALVVEIAPGALRWRVVPR